MCFSWKFHWEDELFTWHPAYPHLGIREEGRKDLERLFTMLLLFDADELVFEAHNAFFEQCIVRNVCVTRLGWPAELANVRRWRCSAAKASTHGLPRSLEEACEKMGTRPKDLAGARVMKKLCKPKKDGTWHESVEEFRILWAYNGEDVLAEEDLSDGLGDLPPFEQEVWFMDQEVNFRGVLVDRALCVKALSLVDEVKRRNNVRFKQLTGLHSASQREAFKLFCWLSDVRLPNTTGDELRHWLEKHEAAVDSDEPWLSRDLLSDDVAEAMRIMYENNRTSTRKYATALKIMDDEDDRIRGSIMYCGAERTWRWAGKLIQPHNYPRGVIADMDAACQFIIENDIETILSEMNLFSKKGTDGELIGFKDIMEFLSHALRGMIAAEAGRELSVSDFAAIEARVVLWYADELEALEIMRSGHCIYCDMATSIYAYPCNKKEHPAERQVGKQAILGLGFGMGDTKFVKTCFKYDIPMENKLAKKIVKIYRKKYRNVVEFWSTQEEAAIAAMRAPGEWVPAGRVRWKREGRFLYCELPSGRCNIYPDPDLTTQMIYYFKAKTHDDVDRWVIVRNPFNARWTQAEVLRRAKKTAKADGLRLVSEHYHEKEKYTLRYMGRDVDENTLRPGEKVPDWGYVYTYGGKLTENIVQATARDLMAAAMVRAHVGGDYDVTLSVHDELVTEVDSYLGDLEEFNATMAEVPEWAEGCPISAEGWRGQRYRK